MRMLCLLGALSLAACSGSSSGGSSGSSGTTTAGTTGGTTGTSSGGGAVFPDASTNGISPVLLRDASGTLHLLYTGAVNGSDGNGPPLRYGECSANCTQASSWHFVTIDGVGSVLGGYAKLALDATGHPRVMYVVQLGSGEPEFHFASCDTGCASAPGNWSKGLAITGDSETSVNVSRSDYFALDPAGHPAFLYRTRDGTFIASCADNCTQAASWSSVGLFDQTFAFSNFTLRFDSSGHVRAALSRGSASGCASGKVLEYLQCDTSCTSRFDDWHFLDLFCEEDQVDFQLRLTSSGQPRIAMYDDFAPSGQNPPFLIYAWCDANCSSDSKNWQSKSLGLHAGYGKGGVDLQLDPSGLPQLAFKIDSTADSVDALGYASCSGSCESASAQWHASVLEQGQNISPAPPADPGCQASWYPGANPSLVLAGTRPQLAYEVNSIESCAGRTSPGADLVRFASP